MVDAAGAPDLNRRLADAVERLGNGVRALAQRSARDCGLTPLQQQVVLALVRQPPVRNEVTVLAAEFDVTRPTMSDAVAALERKGIIDRSASSDGRRRVLSLTAEGLAVADRLQVWDAPVTEALDRIPVDDRAVVLQSLLGTIADLQRRGVISVARVCPSCRFFERDAHDDAAAPHHCSLLEVALPPADLQSDCPEHHPAA
ncbi:MarR family winged helix-turn-helix transcriptional regulator [Gordonia soli]|uniref:Putative MarR family transcriptional regulator n=1 Tax=Gordonia soli NBRC 108243 TaxID=1223545 RepID=M0QIX0_9ACTN|nr:MarR family winged helix-turn-helix transcriptional regulator [Gordonia soli]GAC67357.1 putative MarR family transcriptional regulator [Gordonia soli NBRC 108243]